MKSHTQFKVKKETIMKYYKISACACHLLPRELPRNSPHNRHSKAIRFTVSGLARVLQMKVLRVINW